MGLVKVASFNTTWEAGMVKSVLEAAGIPAFVEAESTAHIGFYLDALHHGVRLLVPDERVDEARGVLERWDAEGKEPGAMSDE